MRFLASHAFSFSLECSLCLRLVGMFGRTAYVRILVSLKIRPFRRSLYLRNNFHIREIPRLFRKFAHLPARHTLLLAVR